MNLLIENNKGVGVLFIYLFIYYNYCGRNESFPIMVLFALGMGRGGRCHLHEFA